jgi:glycine oxidase
MYDFLVIGQGLAGTMLASFLKLAGVRVVLVDEVQPESATRVAAGLMNPVTGRNIVKSWRIDEILPFAIQYYRVLEQRIGISIMRENSIIRALHSIDEENIWLERCADAGYKAYLSDKQVADKLPSWVRAAHSYGEIRGAAQVDVGLLADTLREIWKNEGILIEETLNLRKLKVTSSEVSYGNIEAKKVIFCDGSWGKANPWFGYLPLKGDKGEVLIVKLHTDMPLKYNLKHHLFVVPRQDGTFWVGSNYVSSFQNALPSTQGRAWLEENLRRTVNCSYEVIGHMAAVRPTVSDRRPLLGQHPQHSNLYIFNGLGTKGASLAPFWARHMVTHLLGLSALDPEVDIKRFGLK